MTRWCIATSPGLGTGSNDYLPLRTASLRPRGNQRSIGLPSHHVDAGYIAIGSGGSPKAVLANWKGPERDKAVIGGSIRLAPSLLSAFAARFWETETSGRCRLRSWPAGGADALFAGTMRARRARNMKAAKFARATSWKLSKSSQPKKVEDHKLWTEFLPTTRWSIAIMSESSPPFSPPFIAAQSSTQNPAQCTCPVHGYVQTQWLSLVNTC